MLGRQTLRANAKEIQMAKGQQRGNKEAKKPKQPKKAPAQPNSSIVPPRSSQTVPGRKG